MQSIINMQKRNLSQTFTLPLGAEEYERGRFEHA